MTTTNYENFDAQLDSFLKKRMTAEEEKRFLSKLERNKELLQRAQTIALAIEQMNALKMEQGEHVIRKIRNTREQQFMEEINRSPQLEDFDEQVSKFLKKQMSDEDEKTFKEKLLENPILMERAKTIALTIQQMDEVKKQQGTKVVNIIQDMQENQLLELATAGQKEEVNADTKQKDGVHTTHQKETIMVPLWRKISSYVAAACIIGIIAFGGYRYHQYDATVSLGESYASVLSDEGLFRGSTSDEMQEVKALFDDVANGRNLDAVSAKLDSLYYTAIGEDFNEYTNQANIIGWNAAIAYLKDGKRKEAIKILQSIKNENEGKEIANKADELIEKILEI